MSRSMPQLLNRQHARLAAKGLAAFRAGIGVLAYAIPAVVLRPWIGGEHAGEASVRLLGRSLGARDVALAAGVLLADRHDAPVRGWVEAGGLADAGDLVATLLAWKRLKLTRWGVLALTAGAVVGGALVSPCVDLDS